MNDLEDLWMGIASRDPRFQESRIQESHVLKSRTQESPEQWFFPIHNPSSPDVVTNHESFLPKAILSGDIADFYCLLRWEIARMLRLISCVKGKGFCFLKPLFPTGVIKNLFLKLSHSKKIMNYLNKAKERNIFMSLILKCVFFLSILALKICM